MTPRDRRALAIGLGVVAAAILALRGLPWAVRELRDRRHRLAARSELLIRTEAEIRAARGLSDSARGIESALVALAPQVLLGRQETDAVADLAKRVGIAAAAERIRVVRTVAVPDSGRVGRLRRVSVQASLEGDTGEMLGALARMERPGSPVGVADVRLTAIDAFSAAANPELVEGEILVRGWYVTAAGSAGVP